MAAQRQRVEESIKQARACADAGQWIKAKGFADQASSAGPDPGQRGAIQELYGRLDAEGQRQLKEAQQLLADKKYVQALDTMGLISRVYVPLPAGQAAVKALQQAQADPMVRQTIQETKAAELDQRLQKLIADALSAKAPKTPAPAPAASAAPAGRVEQIKSLAIDKAIQAAAILEQLARQYGQSSAGKQAAEDLKALQADKKLMEAIARQRQAQDAQSALGQGDAYLAAEKFDRAIECYEEVVKKYPQSPAAKKASEKIVLARAKTRGR